MDWTGRLATAVSPFHLPETDRSLETLDLDLRRKQPAVRRTKGLESSSESSTQTSSAGAGKKTAVLLARVKRRLRNYVDEAMEANEMGFTLLERRAVSRKVEKYYKKELTELEPVLLENKVNVNIDSEVDAALVQHMNGLFFKGEQSHRGDKLLASWMHLHPHYGKFGAKKVPRAWRALKGWRKLTPGRSRAAHSLPVWCGVACRLIAKGFLRMAIFLLLSLCSYARPSAMAQLLKAGAVKPVMGITAHWALLLNPQEHGVPSKTGDFDVSIMLDSPFVLTWINPVMEAITKGNPEDGLWDFTYPQYTKEFGLVVKELGMHLVPYQTRHSGPSIDRSRKWRSQAEVQKRGGWKAFKSVMRYEKHARLALEFNKLGFDLQAHLRECEALLEDVVLGKKPAPRLPARIV